MRLRHFLPSQDVCVVVFFSGSVLAPDIQRRPNDIMTQCCATSVNPAFDLINTSLFASRAKGLSGF